MRVTVTGLDPGGIHHAFHEDAKAKGSGASIRHQALQLLEPVLNNHDAA